MLHGFECAPRFVGFALGIEHARLADEGERRECALAAERSEALVGGERLVEFARGFQVGCERMCAAGPQRMERIFFQEILERRGGFLRLAGLAQFIGQPQVRNPGGRRAAPIGDDLAEFLGRFRHRERFLRADALAVLHELDRAPDAHRDERERDEPDDQFPMLNPEGQQIELLLRRRCVRGGGSRRVWLVGIRSG